MSIFQHFAHLYHNFHDIRFIKACNFPALFAYLCNLVVKKWTKSDTPLLS